MKHKNEDDPLFQDGKSDAKKAPKVYDFDDLLALVGGFGRYSILLYALMCVVTIPIGLQQLVQVFYGATPEFTCSKLTADAGNRTCDPGDCCPNFCSDYEFHGIFTSAVSEWHLVCDRRHLKALSQAAYMLGLLVGSVGFSAISDHFGRRITVFLSIGALVVCGTVSGVADCLSLFALFRVGAGAAAAGLLLSRFVYCVELATTATRTHAGFVSNMFMTLGYSVLALAAWLLPDWRHLMLVISAPWCLLLPLWWFIPESPRWLVAHDRLDEAYEVLLKFANKNGARVEPTHLKHVIHEVRKADARKSQTQKYGILDLLKTPRMRRRILICSFNWFVNALIFFGISLNVKNLGGDMYLNFFLLTTIELPSALLAWFCLKRFGRRIPYCAFMLSGGVAGMLVLAVPSDKGYDDVIKTLAMIGKFCILATFLSIYVFTAELFPTVIRNIGIGVSSMMARIGAIIAPYIVLLADLPNVSKTAPQLIFGVLAILAGILALWLPETLFSPMPQTVEQAETWDEDYRFFCCKQPVVLGNETENDGKSKDESAV